MKKMDKLIEGLSIIRKYGQNANFWADSDILFVNDDIILDIEEADIERLTQIGFKYDVENDVWQFEL